MAELTPQERLQPSLLDRLTDDEPGQRNESREKRVISLEKLRQCVLRDLGWLLNTGSLAQTQKLDDHPHVAQSVLNYGVPDLAGDTLSGIDVSAIERELSDAIRCFEPRILPHTIRVRAFVAEGKMSNRALAFQIEGQLWAQPVPLQLYLKTEIDLETGDVAVSEATG